MIVVQTSSQRIEYLDAIRGLAALSVVVYHVITSHWDWMKEAKVAMMVFNGADAVAMFFVLSGLVLSYKVFQRDLVIDAAYYRSFAVSRVFRLYPAFLIMLVIYYFYEHRGENYLTLWAGSRTGSI
ncbi:MAG: acyltransferase family protein [Saprospiraceae bacterium]|nr:acyltransferase family protein [Saprospiraceae bacterium]